MDYICPFQACHIFLVNISTYQGIQIGSTDIDNNSVMVPKEVFSHVDKNKSNGE